jgi:hypothetical protein
MRSFDKDNLVNINSAIFELSKAHNLKSFTGVERGSPKSLTLVNSFVEPELVALKKESRKVVRVELKSKRIAEDPEETV